MSNRINEPQEFTRTDVVRLSKNYDDLGNVVAATFRTYSELVTITSPYVAKHGDEAIFHLSKETIFKDVKKFRPLDDRMFNKMKDSVVDFYNRHKNTKRLQQAHIVTHRSVQYSEEMFEISKCDLLDYIDATTDIRRNYRLANVSKIVIEGLVEPIFVENTDLQGTKYIILRPKLGRSGMPMLNCWEVLLFRKKCGYLIDHIDSNKNPRYNGSFA